MTNDFKKFGEDLNTLGFSSDTYFQKKDWTPDLLEIAYDNARSYYYYSSKLLSKLEPRHFKFLKRASTLFKIAKYFPTENHRKLYTHRLAELFIEGIEIAHKKGVKFTLFSGDELNVLAWAVGLNLTSFDCLKQKFMDYYSSTENSGV